MPERLERARVYRDRAEELRTIAQEWLNEDTTLTIARIARDYERIAEHLERQAKTDGVIPC